MEGPGPRLCDQLITRIKAKDACDSILSWIEEGPAWAEVDREQKLVYVLDTVLHLGSKSFSHLLLRIERLLDLLKKMLESEEAQTQALRIISKFWDSSPLHLEICVDKFMTYRLIPSEKVANWLFSEDASRFGRSVVWALLHCAIQHSVSRAKSTRAAAAAAVGDQAGSLAAIADRAAKDLKGLFLIVFQQFCDALTRKLMDEDVQSAQWCTHTLGQLRSIGRHYHRYIKPFMSTLNNIVFSQEVVHPRIRAAFVAFSHADL